MAHMGDILEEIRQGCVLFDGAMGSMLIARGLPGGTPPETWNLHRADEILSLHRAYLDAGARVITTNTFGATPGKLASKGLQEELERINRSAVQLAREAIKRHPGSETGEARAGPFIALSVGPTGLMLPPVGNATESELRSQFEAQIGCVGEEVDMVLIETMYDLREGFLALQAARTTSSAPVALTLTLDRKPKGFFTMMGDEAVKAITEVERTGADMAGANCTLSSGDMLELARTVRRNATMPLLFQPNAGQPTMRNGTPCYEQPPEEFAEDVAEMIALGVECVGGCCGTTPEFIRAAASRIKTKAGQSDE